MINYSSCDFNTYKKNGFYTVGNYVFNSKVQALIEATKTNTTPEWNFNREVFDQVNWTQRITEDIRSIYQRRAQQLRDKYDYLVLQFSGGSDSTTILEAFINNNIHLDEVQVHWPLKAAAGNYTPDSTNTDPTNFMSEWDFAIRPMLDHIQVIAPKTKIVVSDWSDDIHTEVTEQELTMNNHHLNLGSIKRWNNFTEEFTKHFNRGHSTALICGIDKPQTLIANNSFYFYFLDVLCAWSSTVDRYRERNVEYFYWTPDMPEIIVAQAQLLFDYFSANPQQRYLVETGLAYSHTRKQAYDDVARALIYPDWTFKFQVGKTRHVMLHDNFRFLWSGDRMNTRYMQQWKHATTSILNCIDTKYRTINEFTNEPDGYSGFISPLYKIGSFKD